jgi:hypothetical protein
VADVACVAMEHENCDVQSVLAVRRSDEKGAQMFAIGSRDQEVFVIRDAKLRWFRNVCSSVRREVSRVDDLCLLEV